MPRIAGIDIPDKKRVHIALTYIYGIGTKFSSDILREANVSVDKRAKDLSADEVSRISKIIDRYNTEGNLRKTIRENIERLKRIGTYRGARHIAGLPVRGQRTRVNARTRRGKRKTIGALSKEVAAKTEGTKTE
ncbi:30S ribosomal protein S13 [Microgenomates group bacterium RIFCSPLOWO2_01_FULL_47_10]|nr:MAG: 30S ribosomal protein S13 [Microgenomates group bacterium RIFCSPLOWO2_01_FULL_47_10]